MYQLIPVNVFSAYLTKEALKGVWNFQIIGQIIRTLKYVYDLVLLAKEEAVIQGMI